MIIAYIVKIMLLNVPYVGRWTRLMVSKYMQQINPVYVKLVIILLLIILNAKYVVQNVLLVITEMNAHSVKEKIL